MAWLKKKQAEQPKEVEAPKPAPEVPAKAEEESFDEIAVVKELPVQQIRSVIDKEGKRIKLVTVEEALTEILNAQ